MAPTDTKPEYQSDGIGPVQPGSPATLALRPGRSHKDEPHQLAQRMEWLDTVRLSGCVRKNSRRGCRSGEVSEARHETQREEHGSRHHLDVGGFGRRFNALKGPAECSSQRVMPTCPCSVEFLLEGHGHSIHIKNAL